MYRNIKMTHPKEPHCLIGCVYSLGVSPACLLFFFFLFFCTKDWTQGLTNAKQVPSHPAVPSHFVLSFTLRQAFLKFPRWALNLWSYSLLNCWDYRPMPPSCLVSWHSIYRSLKCCLSFSSLQWDLSDPHEGWFPPVLFTVSFQDLPCSQCSVVKG